MNWWDMERFSAVVFYSIGRYLSMARRNVKGVAEREGNSRSSTLGPPSDEATENLVLSSIRDSCNKIGLEVSTKCAKSLIDLRTKENVTVGEVLDAIHF